MVFILVVIDEFAWVIFSQYLLVSAKAEGFFYVLFRNVLQFFNNLVIVLTFELVLLLRFRNLWRFSHFWFFPFNLRQFFWLLIYFNQYLFTFIHRYFTFI